MKNLSSTFKAEKNKRENQPIILFILHDYDGNNTNLYFAEYDQDVVFNGQTYLRFPIKFDTIDENVSGSVDAVRVRLGNVSRIIQAHLETYDLREKKVTVRLVWANQLADSSAYLDYIFYIDSYSTDALNAEFICTTKIDIVDKQLPGALYLRTHCTHKIFKGSECGYAGAETSCNRSMQRCKELNNFERFGGFPSIPIRRIYVS
jgi:lambda family phage minor tail protein L